MTGRERLTAVLRKAKTDRLPWTTLVDNTTLDSFPPELRGHGGIDFYRYLGCDIFLLNGWNTPYDLHSPQLRWGPHVRVESRREGSTDITTWYTPRGALTSVLERSHPRKYPVDTIEAVRLYRSMWEEASFVEVDDTASLAALDALVDYPNEMDGLIRTMHAREVEAFRALAKGPWSSVTLVENTSTYYISPDIYRRYNMPHQREFVHLIQAAGKPAILHMCGHVRNLLHLIKETGCDGIHALTPPSTGDTPWEAALDVLGEDLIISARPTSSCARLPTASRWSWSASSPSRRGWNATKAEWLLAFRGNYSSRGQEWDADERR